MWSAHLQRQPVTWVELSLAASKRGLLARRDLVDDSCDVLRYSEDAINWESNTIRGL